MSSLHNEAFADQRIELGGVVSRYSPMLFHIALRRLRNVEDAEDAVQDALLSACKHIGQFEGRSQLSSWLTRIVINAAGMKLRGRSRQEIVSLDQAPGDSETTLADELADARPNPEAICAQTEMEETLRTALAHISPKLRVAFQMCEVGGLSTRETADRLRIRTTTLKSRLNRARIALGSYLVQPNRARHAKGSRMAARNRAVGRMRARKYSQAERAIVSSLPSQSGSHVQNLMTPRSLPPATSLKFATHQQSAGLRDVAEYAERISHR